MKIIIGGGTGLVGQILVPELIQSGHDIYVIGRGVIIVWTNGSAATIIRISI